MCISLVLGRGGRGTGGVLYDNMSILPSERERNRNLNVTETADDPAAVVPRPATLGFQFPSSKEKEKRSDDELQALRNYAGPRISYSSSPCITYRHSNIRSCEYDYDLSSRSMNVALRYILGIG